MDMVAVEKWAFPGLWSGWRQKTFERTRRLGAIDVIWHPTLVTQPQPHEKYGEATRRQVVGWVWEIIHVPIPTVLLLMHFRDVLLPHYWSLF